MNKINDVYSISGRIKNHIAMEDLSLSPIGNILVNSYTLILKDLHDFANDLPYPHNNELIKILIEKEAFPRNFMKLITPKQEDLMEDEDDSV